MRLLMRWDGIRMSLTMLMGPGVIAVWQKWERKFLSHFSHNATECTFSMSLGKMVGQGEVGWYTQEVKITWPCLGLAEKIH